MDDTYTGAPDECNIHWPEKLDEDGLCHIDGCPYALTPEEAELAYQLEAKSILKLFSRD